MLSELPGPYVRGDEDCAAWHAFWSGVFEGTVSNPWIRQDWRRVPERLQDVPFVNQVCYCLARKAYERERRTATVQVVKEIRANRMLPWLLHTFLLHPIYLIRHPCAVIGSRLHHHWSHDLSDLESEGRLGGAVRPYLDIIERVSGPLEKMAVIWCIENLVPLSLCEEGRLTLYYYEDFVANPDMHFRSVIQTLQLIPTSRTDIAVTNLVSSPSRKREPRISWHHPLTIEEGRRVLDICHDFGIDIYGESRVPLRQTTERRLVV
jgi:hypothetical protein